MSERIDSSPPSAETMPVDPHLDGARADSTARSEPHVVIEVSGANVVIRATDQVDRECTTSLADVINAATDTNTCVVIDPQPIRCDDIFAAYEPSESERSCAVHEMCRPSEADVAGLGIVRIRAERTIWLIDVRNGRFCQMSQDHEPRFVAEEAWRHIVAVCVTPTRLIALDTDGGLTSAGRAHPAVA